MVLEVGPLVLKVGKSEGTVLEVGKYVDDDGGSLSVGSSVLVGDDVSVGSSVSVGDDVSVGSLVR